MSQLKLGRTSAPRLPQPFADETRLNVGQPGVIGPAAIVNRERLGRAVGEGDFSRTIGGGASPNDAADHRRGEADRGWALNGAAQLTAAKMSH